MSFLGDVEPGRGDGVHNGATLSCSADVEPSDPNEAVCPLPRSVGGMLVGIESARHRDRVYRVVVRLLAVMLLPVAFLAAPRRARHLACQWALAARFPAENLTGLTPEAGAAFEAARTEALWRDGELIGLTSGYREPHEQARLFAEAVRRARSAEVARQWVLPPQESRHVAGTALDVRPVEGALWLERYGPRYHLHRVYDNEWWHFEYCPDGPPHRRAHPGDAIPVQGGVNGDVDRQWRSVAAAPISLLPHPPVE